MSEKLREAAQAVVGSALRVEIGPDTEVWSVNAKALDTLRAALAQPSEPGLDVEAITTAAAGYHAGWWNHDQQNGHSDPDWTRCTEWPCSALARLASEPTDER